MAILIDLLWLAAGLVALYFGAEWLVGASAKLAVRLGISPLVVGLTVVAFGTSSPELFVSLKFNLEGLSDMAVGNVVGSNICNIGLILGVGALVYPLTVKSILVRRDMPIMLAATALFFLLIHDGSVSRIEGMGLFVGVIGYTVFCIRQSRADKDPEVLHEFEEEYGTRESARRDHLGKLIVVILAGLVALYFGSEWLKKGGVSLATRLGVPNAVISLTLIAIATSVPELATSIIASLKREGDIVIGNVVGSNIFNILCVLGLTATSKSMVITEIVTGDLVAMAAFAAVLLPLMLTRWTISRAEGALLLAGYAAYMIYLYFDRVAPAAAT